MEKKATTTKTNDNNLKPLSSSVSTQILLLFLVVILSLVLIFSNILVNVEKEYSFFEIDTSNIEDNFRFEQKVVQLNLTNTNSILPVRRELENMYLCVFNSNSRELKISTRLEPRARTVTEHGFLSSNQRYIDIKRDSTIQIEYFYFPQRDQLQTIRGLEDSNTLKIEFRKTTTSSWNSNFARDICLENEQSVILLQ